MSAYIPFNPDAKVRVEDIPPATPATPATLASESSKSSGSSGGALPYTQFYIAAVLTPSGGETLAPQPLAPDYPCTVCAGTLRWDHHGIWRCVVCWPPEAGGASSGGAPCL
jgi:hypothetical protein